METSNAQRDYSGGQYSLKHQAMALDPLFPALFLGHVRVFCG
jgi:hypothetical protein